MAFEDKSVIRFIFKTLLAHCEDQCQGIVQELQCRSESLLKPPKDLKLFCCQNMKRSRHEGESPPCAGRRRGDNDDQLTPSERSAPLQGRSPCAQQTGNFRDRVGGLVANHLLCILHLCKTAQKAASAVLNSYKGKSVVSLLVSRTTRVSVALTPEIDLSELVMKAFRSALVRSRTLSKYE